MSAQRNHQSPASKLKLAVLIGIPIIFWACAFPFIKLGLTALSPINLAILRLFIACCIFLGLLIILPHKFTRPQKSDIIPLFLLGFFGVIVYHLGLNYGEQYISASAASLIIATIPLFVLIFAIPFLSEKITPIMIGGVIISLTGVIIISLYGTPTASLEISYIVGAIAVLIAAVMGAIYTIAGKKMLNRFSALSITTYAFLFGSLGLIPFLSPSFIQEVSHLSPTVWLAVLFLGIFSSVVAYVLWLMALNEKSASEVSVYLYFIPVLSTLISFTFFNEQLTWLFVLGGVCVLTGLYIVNIEQKKTHQ